MSLSKLKAELRHFAAERDWQPVHTPKNLSTALMVEAPELAEFLKCMTSDESRLARHDAGSKERIGEEVADVLLCLLQVADYSQIDIARAVSPAGSRVHNQQTLRQNRRRSTGHALLKLAAMPGALCNLGIDTKNATRLKSSHSKQRRSLPWRRKRPRSTTIRRTQRRAPRPRLPPIRA